jgi:hypothetical protein
MSMKLLRCTCCIHIRVFQVNFHPNGVYGRRTSRSNDSRTGSDGLAASQLLFMNFWKSDESYNSMLPLNVQLPPALVGSLQAGVVQ